MARDVEARLRLTAQDRTAKAFKSIEQRLNQVERKTTAFNKIQGRMGLEAEAMLLRTVAPAALAYGAAQTVRRYAEVERAVNRIGLTAGATAEETRAAFSRIDQVAYDFALSSDEVKEGLDTLVAAGRGLGDAMSFLPSVAATAQASGAAISDIASTADSVGRNFDIAGDKMQNAFDIMVEGGKAGQFELRDMAQYLPSLAPAFTALGYEGEGGLKKLIASLQAVRVGTGSAGEAATAFANVLQKIESQETVGKFSKFGVDLRAEMAKARAEGRDLIDFFVELTEKTVDGDLSKLPQLFGDAQMIVGMRALINNGDMLVDVMEQLGKAAGSTKKDLDVLLGDSQAKIDRMSTSWDRLVKQVGGGISSVATPLMDTVSNFLDRDSAISRGWDVARGEDKTGREVQREFERKYGLVNPDYGGADYLIDRIGMVSSLNDALEKVGRGEWKTVYDDLDRVEQAGQSQRFAPVGAVIDAETERQKAERKALYEDDRTFAERYPTPDSYVPVQAPLAAAPSTADQNSVAEYWSRKNAFMADTRQNDNADILSRIEALLSRRDEVEARIAKERDGIASGGRSFNWMAESRIATSEGEVSRIDIEVSRLRDLIGEGAETLATSAEGAGNDVKVGAEAGAQALNDAANALRDAANAIGEQGRQAAAAISAVRIPLPNGAAAAGRPPVNANLGQSMPNAGTPGG